MGAFGFLDFILNFPPLAAILAISAAVSLVTTIVYKYTTNQKLMKEIKDDVKRMQSEARAAKEPGKAAEIQKEMMKRSMQQFSASTKSMIITLVPLFLIFGWMGSHLAYEPISQGDEFTTTMKFGPGVAGQASLAAGEGVQLLSNSTQETANGAAVWRLKAVEKGPHTLAYRFGNEQYSLGILVTDKFKYENPILSQKKGIKKGSAINQISIDLSPVRPFGDLSLGGWNPGWLATYIIFSLASSILIRKLMKVH